MDPCHQSAVCDVADIAKRKSDLRLVSNPLYWDPLGNGRGWFHCGQINLPIERVPIAEVVKEQIKPCSSKRKKLLLQQAQEAYRVIKRSVGRTRVRFSFISRDFSVLLYARKPRVARHFTRGTIEGHERYNNRNPVTRGFVRALFN